MAPKNTTYAAKSYEDFAKYDRVKFKLKELALDKQASVLDIGCAKGGLLYALRQTGFNGRYLGIDNDPEMIEIAKSFFKEDSRASFSVASFEENTDVRGDFELVTLWGLVSFYDNYEILVKTCLDKLAPEGALSIWSGFNRSQYDVLVDYVDDRGAHFSGLNMFSLPKLVSFLEKEGLEVAISKFSPSANLTRDADNPLVSYSLNDEVYGTVVVNDLNIVREFYHLLVTKP